MLNMLKINMGRFINRLDRQSSTDDWRRRDYINLFTKSYKKCDGMILLKLLFCKVRKLRLRQMIFRKLLVYNLKIVIIYFLNLGCYKT